MRVLFAAAEVAPLIKTGGLADVAGALPAALRAAGHDVRVVMPRYRELRERGVPMEGPIAASFLSVNENAEQLLVWRLMGSAVPVYLLDIPAAFERSAIYGESDDDRRFILFSRGVLALMQHLREVEGWNPELVHANDWHSALIANYIKTVHSYTFGHIASVFTIHNLAYQGQFGPRSLALAGLSAHGALEEAVGPGTAGTFNCMARGIAFSDFVSTVSPTYAKEIMTPEYGERLHGLLRRRHERVAGILNGIDTDTYDPATDPHLAARFSASDPSGKEQCKAALQVELGLPVDAERPLLGIVTRLVGQKGVELLHTVIPWLLRQTDAQLVLLGSGEARFEEAFRGHSAAHRDRIAARIGFDMPLAQRIYAGSDAFLMPSRFEPCGLGQMIALRYGSVPIVRATGGLNDTVHEGENGNGFRFHPYDAGEFGNAIGRALQAFRNPARWGAIRERGMREDHSWTASARQYERMYERARRLIGR